MNLKISDNGLSKRIVALGNKIPSDEEQATKKSVLYYHSQVPPYPPLLPGMADGRTGTLGRSVTAMGSKAEGATSRVVKELGDWVGYVGTNIVYAIRVIKKGSQARAHQGRWWTLESTLDKARPGIIKIYNKMVKGWASRFR